LRLLGFTGPFPGGRHHFLVWNQHRFTIPSNPEYSVPQLRMLFRELAGILGRELSLSDWEALS